MLFASNGYQCEFLHLMLMCFPVILMLVAVFAVVPMNALSCTPSSKPETTGFGTFDGETYVLKIRNSFR